MKTRFLACVLCLLSASVVPAQTAPDRINPTARKIVDGISEENVTATLKKLESLRTRNIYSAQDSPTEGIGAAARWIADQFRAYSLRLQVSFDKYRVKKQGRVFRDVEIANVVAILPGKLHPERHLIVGGHYDSLNMVFKPQTDKKKRKELDNEATVAATAPGVTDDGSGTAAVLEMARVMSQYEFDDTVVFIAFSGEEYGLLGSRLYAAKARKSNMIVDAMFNNDLIGSDVAGDGATNNHTVRLFSEEPSDSSSREVARYIKEVAERYVPDMTVDLIFRHERFGRGGDHTPFNLNNYAAVRFTTSEENYSNQHTATDTFANTSVPYTTRVAKVNAAALASLALAPKAPVVTRQVTTGPYKGALIPEIGRGKSGYDALLRWTGDHPEPDLAGYAIVTRSTTAPEWQREIFVGNVKEYRLPDVSIDDVVFGVKAIDKDGNESLVSPYVVGVRPLPALATY